ncbi:MAG TPA: glutathione S-transferase family protein [Solirubrobacterales bacterium]|nr:glutathione S-transferase family protein [Solirubrobacterales bacterium]
MTVQTEQKPVLWQIEISHYSEKVRWALEHKGIDHVRRTPLPGTHIPIALVMTRGEQPTFPVMQIDSRTIGDSTAIVAALEERYPEPPLYPADTQERARALELEDYFDEQLGPYTRFLTFHELINEPEVFAEVASEAVPGPLGQVKPLVGAYARTFTSLRWGARDADKAELARKRIVAALDRLDAELERSGGEYLAGGNLSVADITAASLFYPLVLPPEGPVSPDAPRPPALERFRKSLSDRRGYRWIEETFRRHRHRP